jgi:hypothetical protein
MEQSFMTGFGQWHVNKLDVSTSFEECFFLFPPYMPAAAKKA